MKSLIEVKAMDEKSTGKICPYKGGDHWYADCVTTRCAKWDTVKGACTRT
jgi:hypothetical protein